MQNQLTCVRFVTLTLDTLAYVTESEEGDSLLLCNVFYLFPIQIPERNLLTQYIALLKDSKDGNLENLAIMLLLK